MNIYYVFSINYMFSTKYSCIFLLNYIFETTFCQYLFSVNLMYYTMDSCSCFYAVDDTDLSCKLPLKQHCISMFGIKMVFKCCCLFTENCGFNLSSIVQTHEHKDNDFFRMAFNINLVCQYDSWLLVCFFYVDRSCVVLIYWKSQLSQLLSCM